MGDLDQMEEEIQPIDSSGFYKNENGSLQFGPNAIDGPALELRRETQDQNVYPISDWYWFESRAEALTFFGIEEVSNEEDCDCA